MAKKTTLLLIVSVLLIAMSAFVACKQNPINPPDPSSEDYINPEGTNLLSGCDFEKGDDNHDVVDDGSTIEVVEGVGLKGSAALSVEQTESYGQVYIDVTEFYGAGKDYYLAASFKNNDSTNTKDLTAKLSFTVVPGWVMDEIAKVIAEEGEDADGAHDYDYDAIYEGSFLPDEDAMELYGITTSPEVALGSSYVRVSGIIPSDEIEAIIQQTGMAKFLIVFYVGSYPNQGGYNYYLDDLVFIDLDKTGLPYGPYYTERNE